MCIEGGSFLVNHDRALGCRCLSFVHPAVSRFHYITFPSTHVHHLDFIEIKKTIQHTCGFTNRRKVLLRLAKDVLSDLDMCYNKYTWGHLIHFALIAGTIILLKDFGTR